MKVQTSCDRLWRKRLDALVTAWPTLIRGDIDALHQARVASRRLREALPVVGAGAERAKVRKLGRRIREVTRLLGPIRQLDVELRMLEGEDGGQGAHGRAIALVRRKVASERQALRRRLSRRVEAADLDKLVRKLERIASSEPGKNGDSWQACLAARCLRRAKWLRAALDEASPLYVPSRVHEVRIAVKKLRYALELAQETGAHGARALVTSLKRHQERLGRLNDLQSLRAHIRELEASDVRGSRTAELTAYAEALERQCSRLHAEFVAERDALLAIADAVRGELIAELTKPRARATGARRAVGARMRPEGKEGKEGRLRAG